MRPAILSLILAFASCPAFAMMCADTSDEKALRESEIAFTGEVIALTDSPYKPLPYCWVKSAEKPKCGGRLATVKVGEWLRGSGGETVTVLKEDGCYCLGGYWAAGDSNLFIARKNLMPSRLVGDFIAESICEGTGALNEKRAALVVKFKSQPIRAQIK